jgi:hypothetical protein
MTYCVYLSLEEVAFQKKQLMHRKSGKLPAVLLLLVLLLVLLVPTACCACGAFTCLGAMHNNDVCIR